MLTSWCGGTCASDGTRTECTTFESELSGEHCDPESDTDLCDRANIHEQLHNLGLGYHQGGKKCSAEDIAAGKPWRECPSEDYGGIMDVLGSINTEGKGSWGVAAKTRFDLGWLSKEDGDVRVVEIVEGVSETLSLRPLGAGSGLRAVEVAPPEDSVLSSLGTIWLECRAAEGFDTIAGERVGGFNVNGVLAYHWGVSLIDLEPNATDPDDALKARAFLLPRLSVTLCLLCPPPPPSPQTHTHTHTDTHPCPLALRSLTEAAVRSCAGGPSGPRRRVLRRGVWDDPRGPQRW